MSTPGERVAAMLAALEKLPPYRGLTFRGLPAGVEPPEGTVVTHLLTATSRDPRVATENFAHPAVAAILSHLGRDVGPLSADPSAAEVVLLPGSMLHPVARIQLQEPELLVCVLEQLDPARGGPPDMTGLPSTLDDLMNAVMNAVVGAAQSALTPIGQPGRFAGPIE